MAHESSMDESSMNSRLSNPDPPAPHPDATHEEILAAKLPTEETNQPDPILQLSVGRIGAGPVALVAVIAALILGVVFYALNSSAPNAQDVGTRPTASSAVQPPANAAHP